MKHFTKIHFFLIFGVILSFSAILPDGSQNFQGSIRYKKISLSDTTYLQYHIKNRQVRIEKYAQDGEFLEFTIIDFDRNSLIIADPKEKLFVRKKLDAPGIKTLQVSVDVQNTGNYKYIQGYKCYQWLVKNKAQNVVVSFWVTDSHYDFYDAVLKSLSETEKISDYYSYISGNQGFIPLQSVENTWLRDHRMSLTAEKIEMRELPDKLFDIPENFEAFE